MIARTNAFEQYAIQYDKWFEDHRYAYESELEAIRKLLPKSGTGLEVGVGSGRFAGPLGIKLGVEPSKTMRELAKGRNINAVDGVAEALPFPDESYDYILFVTTICFVDSLEKTFKGAFRVLKSGGAVVIGFVDKNSSLGLEYERRRNESRFYREAFFRSPDEVTTCLKNVGFDGIQFAQTIFKPLPEITAKEPVKDGCGEGAFVVIRAEKRP